LKTGELLQNTAKTKTYMCVREEDKQSWGQTESIYQNNLTNTTTK